MTPRGPRSAPPPGPAAPRRADGRGLPRHLVRRGGGWDPRHDPEYLATRPAAAAEWRFGRLWHELLATRPGRGAECCVTRGRDLAPAVSRARLVPGLGLHCRGARRRRAGAAGVRRADAGDPPPEQRRHELRQHRCDRPRRSPSPQHLHRLRTALPTPPQSRLPIPPHDRLHQPLQAPLNPGSRSNIRVRPRCRRTLPRADRSSKSKPATPPRASNGRYRAPVYDNPEFHITTPVPSQTKSRAPESRPGALRPL